MPLVAPDRRDTVDTLPLPPIHCLPRDRGNGICSHFTSQCHIFARRPHSYLNRILSASYLMLLSACDCVVFLPVSAALCPSVHGQCGAQVPLLHVELPSLWRKKEIKREDVKRMGKEDSKGKRKRGGSEGRKGGEDGCGLVLQASSSGGAK